MDEALSFPPLILPLFLPLCLVSSRTERPLGISLSPLSGRVLMPHQSQDFRMGVDPPSEWGCDNLAFLFMFDIFHSGPRA